ncbi:hypothetical protein [Deinococcus aquaedulcis]|nr:hypothetical protein [Deinococcus aquaedulcis]
MNAIVLVLVLVWGAGAHLVKVPPTTVPGETQPMPLDEGTYPVGG